MALVVWSGGCDSTLVLHDLAKEMDNVRALSIQHFQVNAVNESEDARKQLLAKLERRGLKIRHSTVRLDQNSYDLQGESWEGCNAQPVIWLSIAITYLREDEDLYFGYHRGDDFWQDAEDFRKAFQALQAIRCGKGQLRFPLEAATKADIIRRLQGLGLYKDCWYCEEPAVTKIRKLSKPCGRCRPCVTHQTALWQIREGLA